MRSPVQWLGGKGRMAAKLKRLMPPHLHYVEVFGGGAWLLFAKAPAGGIEVYNDLDHGLVDFFRVLRDEEQFTRFRRLVELTPYARTEYKFCRETWQECDDVVERARRWFVVARMSFGGIFGNAWGFDVATTNRGMAKGTSAYLSAITLLPQMHVRLMPVQIECADFRDIVQRYDADKTLMYCDPPYVMETRRSRGYMHEMSEADHADLVVLLLDYPALAMVSGYEHSLYTPLEEAGWQRYDFEVACHTAGRTRATGILGEGAAQRMQARTESVWLNPLAQRARGGNLLEWKNGA